MIRFWNEEEREKAIEEMRGLQGLLSEQMRRQSLEDSLIDEIRALRRFIAALAHEAGGELSVHERTLVTQEPQQELLIWQDIETHKWRVRITS